MRYSLDMLMRARHRVVNVAAVSVGAAVFYVNLRPAADNLLWIPTFITGYQTSGGARSCYWEYNDVATGAQALHGAVNLASGARWPIHTDGADHLHLVELNPCDYFHYYRFAVTALGAAEDAGIVATVLEILTGTAEY